MLVLSMTSPNLRADSSCNEVYDKYDRVVEKQGQLIMLLTDQNESVRSENDELSAALVKMKGLTDQANSRTLYTGLSAVLAGAVIGILVKK